MASFDFRRRIAGSQNRFFLAWLAVRICPDQIQAPSKVLSFNILTLFISIVIFFLARKSLAVNDNDMAISFVANIISTIIMFMSGFLAILFFPGENAIVKSEKWGVFFIMIWIVSLILIVIDAIPFWVGYEALTATAVEGVFGLDTFLPWQSDLVRAVLLSSISILLMLYKSKRMDKTFKPLSLCAVCTCALALVVNILLLEGFIYGHLV